MALGRMTIPAVIKRDTLTKDAEGFSTRTATTVFAARVWREGRHGSQRWANLAAFSEATDLFRLRDVGVTVKVGDYIEVGSDRWDIESVELVKGRGMYLEILATKVTPAATNSGAEPEEPPTPPTPPTPSGTEESNG